MDGEAKNTRKDSPDDEGPERKSLKEECIAKVEMSRVNLFQKETEPPAIFASKSSFSLFLSVQHLLPRQAYRPRVSESYSRTEREKQAKKFLHIKI